MTFRKPGLKLKRTIQRCLRFHKALRRTIVSEVRKRLSFGELRIRRCKIGIETYRLLKAFDCHAEILICNQAFGIGQAAQVCLIRFRIDFPRSC